MKNWYSYFVHYIRGTQIVSVIAYIAIIEQVGLIQFSIKLFSLYEFKYAKMALVFNNNMP